MIPAFVVLVCLAIVLYLGIFAFRKGSSSKEDYFVAGRSLGPYVFLLEMGLVAGRRPGDLRKVGPFLLAFGIVMPLLHGCLGVWLGQLTGLGLGGATLLGVLASSASYIAAPAAIRMSLPDADPTYHLTASLAITFPFNIALGIPAYLAVARWLYS